ncbi:MAG TPA: TAXI family TRAP transporter solute-binding subunit, partial [Candidatus Acidoferrales bacterium]|nr:TAXI family TRAP transporter solute-binding subunit [Candidatus Acidoferrales bacterium]
QMVFAVKRETGLTTFEEIGERRFPLKISTRGTPGHSLHFMLDAIASAAGFSFEKLTGWGGELSREGSFPNANGPKAAALARGEFQAFFEEGADEWLPLALGAGMIPLPLAEETVRKLEAIGLRRAKILKARYPELAADVLTVSFSGWPVFVHAELPDELASRLCAALDARKHLVPWQGEGPLPVERMCRDSAATPIDVPLHPGAERFWRERGYL